jgi:glycerate 2-kinase
VTTTDSAFPAERTSPITNADALLANGMTELRSVALRIASAGINACDPSHAAASIVTLTDSSLHIGDVTLDLDDVDRIVVLGAGKATARIAQALEGVLGSRIDGGMVVVPPNERVELDRIEVVVGDHPLPTERSLSAALRLMDWAEGLGERDVVLACFTGGCSALAALPMGEITVADKQALTKLLLGSGLPVTATNLVRRHVSAFKGGRLAQAISPARVINLTVSDVAHDPLEAITDPTVRDTSRPEEAIAILHESGLWKDTPITVREHLQRATLPPSIDQPPTVLLATGRTACDAMVREAAQAGFPARMISTALEGESQGIGSFLATLARESAQNREPFSPPCILVGAGGESTVSLDPDSDFGAGGPNQEAAIAAALALLDHDPVALIFMDSDGSDGGTRLAGGIVDGMTAARASGAGIDLRAALREHRASSALDRLGDGIVTGSTGTNVNDLFVIAIGAGADVGVR